MPHGRHQGKIRHVQQRATCRVENLKGYKLRDAASHTVASKQPVEYMVDPS
eukprot:m.30714 g.30714  ORF g.30714 m.30714 type:complete len:51 (-) comp9526_c0_seq1:70-222(-)